ncbi:Ribosome bioproteinsis protein nsa1 (NOP7-associated protein 1) [Savitreella phatthalungensis]
MHLITADDRGRIRRWPLSRQDDAMDKTRSKPVPRFVVADDKDAVPISVMRLVEWRDSLLLIYVRRDGRMRMLDIIDGKERFRLDCACVGDKQDMREAEMVVSIDTWQSGPGESGTLVVAVASNAGRVQLVLVKTNGELKTSMFNTAAGSAVDVIRLATGNDGFPCLAFGGKETDLEILRSKSSGDDLAWFALDDYWKARNVKDDELGLRVPIWISGISFLPASEGYRIVTCTRFSQVRLYDTARGRRPFASIELGQYPLTHMVLKEHEAIVTDTHGTVYAYDVEERKLKGTFKGFSGAVSGIAIDKDVLAVAGVDGFLRIYDAETHKQVASAYTGKKLTHIAASSKLDVLEVPESKEEEDSASGSDVWEELEEIEEPLSKRRKQ